MTESLFRREGRFEEAVEAAQQDLAHRLPELRDLPGFPVGSDEEILNLSVPPFFTACPNPFIGDWLSDSEPQDQGDGPYRDPGPFASDVSEGKGHPYYKAHSFWTKVPHRAIMRYILHYTRPGDVVLDGFAGSGMTALAAQECGSPEADFRALAEQQIPHVEWGARRAIVQDLSPYSSLIAAGMNLPMDGDAFEEASSELLRDFNDEFGWMYQTAHRDGSLAKIDYTVWSEVFSCAHCGGEVVHYDEAFVRGRDQVRKEFPCPNCGRHTGKSDLEHRMVSVQTPAGMQTRAEFRPVRVYYRVGSEFFDKRPDGADIEVIDAARKVPLTGFPSDEIPIERLWHGYMFGPRGITRMHHVWSPRALVSVTELWRRASAVQDPELRLALRFWVEQSFYGLSWMNRYRSHRYSQTNNQMMGVYYFPSLHAEVHPEMNLSGRIASKGKRQSLMRFWSRPMQPDLVRISTGSSERILIPDESVDYVFVDPPFGLNIQYADLNRVVESWYGVMTADSSEAVVHRVRGVDVSQYSRLLRECFREFFRVLKPGRWITVEFSNSSNEIWLSLQEALLSAGFVVADTRILDKKQGSWIQVRRPNAVKHDIVISAYKPSSEIEERFGLVAGTTEGAWEFVREHLSHLPVSEGSRGEARVVRERMADRLYDRMVAYHVHRGVTVPLTTSEFYAGLEQRFPVRDDMYFLSEQVEEYERHRMTVKELIQAELFITNEQSAVQWLRQFLKRKPRTYSEIQPVFFDELQAGLPDWEELPELRELLEGSFLQDGEDRWYVPDPKKAEDLERLRTRALLREFEAYLEGSRKLDRFRSEAVRAGFKDAWGRRDFATIVAVGKRLPEDAFVEDEALLYYYDNARRLASPA